MGSKDNTHKRRIAMMHAKDGIEYYVLTAEDAAAYDDPDVRVWRELMSRLPLIDIYHPDGFMIRSAVQS